MEEISPSEITPSMAELQQEREDRAWRELERACFALGGVHGAQRKSAKQKLLEAMERVQKLGEKQQAEREINRLEWTQEAGGSFGQCTLKHPS